MLTNKQAIDLVMFMVSEEFEKLDKTIKGYVKSKKIKKTLMEFAKELEETEKEIKKPTPEFLAFEEHKIEKIKPFVLCSDEGKPILGERGEVTVLEGKEAELKATILPINAANIKLIQEQNRQNAKWLDFLNNEEALVELTLLKEDEITIPEKGSSQLFDNLSLLVPGLFDDLEEEDEEASKEEPDKEDNE